MIDNHGYKKTRRQALEAGDEFYFSGKMCKNGGFDLRKVKDYKCICEFCVKKERDRAYQYMLENPEKCKNRHKRWSELNKEYLKLKMRYYYIENKEDIKRRSAEWVLSNPLLAKHSRKMYYINNKDRINEKARCYHWENRGRILERQNLYYVDNKDKFLSYSSKRRAAIIERIAPWFGEFDDFVIKEAHDLAKERSELTCAKWAVDHRVPLQGVNFSGLHCANNIQVIPASVNRSKSNVLLYIEDLEWMDVLSSG